MNIDRFHQILNQQLPILHEDMLLLKELKNKFPYSQLFTILYLTGLHESKNISFEEELQKNAFRITDREKLFSIIHFPERKFNIEQENDCCNRTYSRASPRK